ncbi:MAG: putative electron transport protein YccM [Candidatus Heimdallarchaeota archaeon LC_3]|nr:MAG: putative electron transport protein YccM [Candidatus Heimdallarchaeota archaeon LC_3]
MSTKTYEKSKYYLTTHRGIRHLVQLFFFILLNSAFLGITAIWLVLPINQPPTPFSISDGALYSLTVQAINLVFPFIPIASFFIIGSLMGKTLCGWVCPMGFAQDILTLISPFRKRYPTKTTNESWSDVAKLFALVMIFFSFFIGFAKLIGGDEGLFNIKESFGTLADDPLAIFDPAATLFAYFPYMIQSGNYPTLDAGFINILGNFDVLVFWVKLTLLFIAIILPMFYPRAFCRYICPTGAVMSPISKHSLIGMNRNIALCNQCLACEIICPMGVRLLDHPERLRDPLCINCLDCVHVCDTGALSFKIS